MYNHWSEEEEEEEDFISDKEITGCLRVLAVAVIAVLCVISYCVL